MKTDLEVSTFQKRPAYRYIREADNVPAIGAGATVALIKLFDPTGGWTWYISEYDPKTREAFGLVDGFEKELGYFNMEEIIDLRGRFGLPVATLGATATGGTSFVTLPKTSVRKITL